MQDVPQIDYDSLIRDKAVKMGRASIPKEVLDFMDKYPRFSPPARELYCRDFGYIRFHGDPEDANLVPEINKVIAPLVAKRSEQAASRRKLAAELAALLSNVRTHKQLQLQLQSLALISKLVPVVPLTQTLPATTETFAKLRAAGWKPKTAKAKKA
jgi:hypothetical protein